MTGSKPVGCPMTRAQVIDAYFMEHRAKVIDIAAYLDRIERASGAGGDAKPAGDGGEKSSKSDERRRGHVHGGMKPPRRA